MCGELLLRVGVPCLILVGDEFKDDAEADWFKVDAGIVISGLLLLSFLLSRMRLSSAYYC